MKTSASGVAQALAAVLILASGSAVLAQLSGEQDTGGDHMQHGGAVMPDIPMMTEPRGDADRAYMEAMHGMMQDMQAMEMTGDPGTDFARMMIPHHQSAVDMAEAYLEHGNDPELRRLAEDIVRTQPKEIDEFEAWLEENGRN